MYKIYINSTPLFIANSKYVKKLFPITKGALIARYSGKPKSLLNYIDSLEKPNKFTFVVLHSKDFKACFQEFKAVFKVIEAAGGLVFKKPKKKKILMIHRQGFYDLPKGKIDKGEQIKAAAIREVKEETGVKKLKLGKKITKTYHTYRDRKNRRVLKKTHWYRMTAKQKKFIPQLEEDIDFVFWIKPEKFLSVHRKVYGNILDVIRTELARNL